MNASSGVIDIMSHNNTEVKTNNMTCPVRLIEYSDQWYSPIFDKLDTGLGVVGVLMNTINLAVFMHKRLKSPTAVIMSATALADTTASAIYVPSTWYTWKEAIHAGNYVLVKFYCRHFFILFYNISIWLQVMLAAWRNLAIYYPMHFQSFCNLRKTCCITVACYVLSIVLYVPLFICSVPLEIIRDGTLFLSDQPDKYGQSYRYRIQIILFQFIPCAALTVFTVGLIMRVLNNDRKFRSTAQRAIVVSYKTGTDHSSFCETEKTTKMLTVILAVFWTIEASVGIFPFVRLIYGRVCYNRAMKFADTLRLAYIDFKIVIYYAMSKHYRSTVRSLIPCKPVNSASVPISTIGRKTDTYSLHGSCFR